MTVRNLEIRRLDSSAQTFADDLRGLLAWDLVADPALETQVRSILDDVRTRGDAALIEYSRRFDRLALDRGADLELPRDRLQQALASIHPEQRQALELAAERIRDFHRRQLQDSWEYSTGDGSVLGQRITSLERVGLYVPGGKAAYPSSVLMNAIPARVAGVDELIMVVPAPDGVLNDLVLAAAEIAGVDRVFRIGGAQAIAALAFGTATVPAVDKIVGPGNAFVATAKRLVFGRVGLDMIAGPSEILVICDGDTDPDWIALDLLSQAEHDEQAQSLLLSPDANFLDRVAERMGALLPGLEREPIARASLAARGALIRVASLEQACALSNRIAPEHLELSVADPNSLLPLIRHAGAIFMGRHTPEALGDYCAGPNHVLPTSGTARFSSPLGVYDFQKRSSLIHCSASGAAALAPIAEVLALGEGLTAHARSAAARRQSPGEAGHE